jgi:two-component system invasion response regulator UvrY
MPKILIVEDHPIFRYGLKELLAREPGFALIGEAADALEASEQLRKEHWDAVILDINLPEKSGLEFLNELKQQWPKIPKLVLSAYPEEEYALRALKAGASGYVTKDRTSDELLKALTKLLRGEKYISNSLAEKLVTDLERPAIPHDLLSNREYEVMKMIAAGKPPREVADQLFISRRTVNTFRARILKKLDLKNNAEIVQYVIQNKLED